MTATATPSPPTGRAARPGITTVLPGLLLVIFLASLDQLIVSTAIRTIGDDLHGLSSLAWATTAYLITSTISTPVYGRLSDLFGRKRLLLTAVGIFTVGSALCGLATSMPMLAAFRALQGLGGGGMLALVVAVIGDLVSPRERGRYQGHTMSAMTLGSVLGPVLGGLLAGQGTILGIAGWRWIFWINVPVGLVALMVLRRVLRLTTTRRDRHIDWWGAALLALGLTPLLLIAEQGGAWGWASGRAVGCYAVAALGLAGLVTVSVRKGADALIPLRLFRTNNFTVSIIGTFVLGLAQFGGLGVLPLYLQLVKGASPAKAGLLILPIALGQTAASFAAGRFTAHTGRYKSLAIAGTALLGCGLFAMASVSADTSLWITGGYMFAFGAGAGLAGNALMTALTNSLPPADMGAGTSSLSLFRGLGGTAGAALLLALLFAQAGPAIADRYEAADASPAFRHAAAQHPHDLAEVHHPDLNDTAFLDHLDPALARPFLDGFGHALDQVMLTAGGIVALAFLILLGLKQVSLRTEPPTEPPASG